MAHVAALAVGSAFAICVPAARRTGQWGAPREARTREFGLMRAMGASGKLLARVRQFDFGAKDVDQMVVTWPVDFLPS